MTTDAEIYCYYLGVDELQIGTNYRSPLRADRSPSFSLFASTNNEGQDVIIWKDHGLADQYGHFAIHLIMHAEDIDFKGAQRMIRNELFRGLSKPKVSTLRSSIKTPKLSVRDHWKDFELDYWADYGITEETLLKESIYPCEHLSWSGRTDYYEISRIYDPIFIYLFGDDSWKKYRPFGEKGSKWASWNLTGVIEGYDTLADDGELLLIWKGTKDRIIGKQLGFDIINPTGESHFKYIVEKKYELEQRFDDQLIMYDADDAGYKGALKLANETGWKMIDTRGIIKGTAYDWKKKKKIKIKDFAEIRLYKGEEKLLKTINKCILTRKQPS